MGSRMVVAAAMNQRLRNQDATAAVGRATAGLAVVQVGVVQAAAESLVLLTTASATMDTFSDA